MEELVEINDIRIQKHFTGISFSNFKKTEVIKELLQNIQYSKIEPALYWCGELICSGNYLILWENIIQFYSKYIQMGNPKLIIYLELKFNTFKSIICMYKDDELVLRNNLKIRKLFAEIICILCFSTKNHTFQNIKIKPDDLILNNIGEKIKTEGIDYLNDYYRTQDPDALYIPFNEFVYALHNKNSMDSIYWFEYIINFETILKKDGQRIQCERRLFPVDEKLQKDIIWIFWEILIDFANNNKPLLTKIVMSTLNMYCIKFMPSSKNKRKYLLYYIITLLCTNIVIEDIDIIKQREKEYILIILSKLNNIYIQIKNNEISPKTEYLFKDNNKQKNLEMTIDRLNKMNSFDLDFMPRTNTTNDDDTLSTSDYSDLSDDDNY